MRKSNVTKEEFRKTKMLQEMGFTITDVADKTGRSYDRVRRIYSVDTFEEYKIIHCGTHHKTAKEEPKIEQAMIGQENEQEKALDIPEWLVPAIPRITNKATTEELILRHIHAEMSNTEALIRRLTTMMEELLKSLGCKVD